MTSNAQAGEDFCPECGARRQEGMDCPAMLGGLIEREYTDEELLKEHFLTVASYNLQHPASFNNEAVEGLREALLGHLNEGLSVSEIRNRNAKTYNGPKRVRKPESERRIQYRAWPMTIADVYIPGRLNGAAARVRKWAHSVCSEI